MLALKPVDPAGAHFQLAQGVSGGAQRPDEAKDEVLSVARSRAGLQAARKSYCWN